MKEKSNIFKNFLYNMAYQVLLVITPLIVSPYISRVLGSDGIGIYTYTYSIAHYFAMFCMLGVNNHGSRTVAVCREDKKELSRTFSEIYSMQFYVSMIAVAAYLIYVFVISAPIYTNFFALQMFFILSFATDINWLYFGLEEFKITVVRKVIIKILTVILIFAFVNDSNDVAKYTLIMSGTYLISEGYLWFFIKKKVDFRIVSPKRAIQHLKPLVVLFVPIVAVSVYRIMDKIMLGNMADMNSVGQYENAEKIIMVCLGVVSALGTIMIPRMSKLNADNDSETMKRYFLNSMRFIMFFACGVTFGIISVGKSFAPIFFGREFAECGSVMQVLAVSVLFIAWSNVVRTQHLIPCHKDRIYIIAVWSGAVVNFCLNCLLIRHNGAVGAAVATVITEFVVCIIQSVCVRKDINVMNLLKNTLPFVVCGAIMWLVIVVVGNSVKLNDVLLLTIQVISGVVIYLICSFIYVLIFDNKMVMACINGVKKRFIKK